jgi:predicted membrane-bound mannosyltransferase
MDDHINTPTTAIGESQHAAFTPSRAGSEARPVLSSRLSWLVLAGIALLYISVSFTPVIFDDNEGLYADAVREMHARGDWLVPMSNGFPRVQKPPLVYWTMLVSTSLLGENEFALRLPNALATVLWIATTYLIARRIGGERFGLAAALASGSSPIWCSRSRFWPALFRWPCGACLRRDIRVRRRGRRRAGISGSGFFLRWAR